MQAPKNAIAACKRAYRTYRQHGEFTDSPWQRLGDLLLKLLRDPVLPTVVLGGLIGSYIQFRAGLVPASVVWMFVGAELLAVFLYVVGDEIARVIESIQEAYDEDETTDRTYH